MVICVPVTTDGMIDSRWGRAARVAIIRVDDGAISADDEYDVGWDASHDAGTEGGHHARIARLLAEFGVEAVVADHMGPPMAQMLDKMGIKASLGATGDARSAAIAAAATDAQS